MWFKMFCFFVFTSFRARFDRSSEFVQETSGFNGKNKGNMYVKHTDTFFFEKLLSLLQRKKSSKAAGQKRQMIVSKKILAVSFPCGTVFNSTCINSLLQTEIAGHEPRIRAVCDNGVQMIDNGRYQENEYFHRENACSESLIFKLHAPFNILVVHWPIWVCYFSQT